jgi:hypothetical protein
LERSEWQRISNEIILSSAQFLLEKKLTMPILKMAATLELPRQFFETEIELRKLDKDFEVFRETFSENP